jgi:hypothetical protein
VGKEVDQTVYHVLLEGRTVGPYDRRTIVGMRIKKALTSEHVLVGADGSRLTVADLIGRSPAVAFQPDLSGSFSGIQSRYPAWLVHARGRGAVDIPRFKGEIEARVQGDRLRLAGRFRKGFGWKDGRIKIPMTDVLHARVTGSQVELWLRGARPARQQRVALELFTPEVATEFLERLPASAVSAASGAAVQRSASAAAGYGAFWVSTLATVAVAVTIALVLLVLLYHRGGR